MAKKLADQVSIDAYRLILIFAGFMRAWQLQVGMTNVPIPDDALMAEIDRTYAPLIDRLVHEKED